MTGSHDTSRGDLTIEAADPHSAEVAGLLTSYLDEIAATFGYDDAHGAPADPEEFVSPRGAFFVVRDGDAATGCGGVRLLADGSAEIKRMWLHPSLRGRGAGRKLLQALENEAVSLGATRAVLDTNATLESAVALYRTTGWVETEKYNDNDQATHWFTKDLTPLVEG